MLHVKYLLAEFENLVISENSIFYRVTVYGGSKAFCCCDFMVCFM